ncbi:uncharacterized protein METZ01_LOCUS332066 [marine metagenome]|uniref:Uncharacterized protein n=1 Tax=marine metagenome TaxID=408172 RepID=A0A382Q442_9ZZZZ
MKKTYKEFQEQELEKTISYYSSLT